MNDRETRATTAFVSVYNVTKQFGGHEEGGWWYDSYEWLKVAVPFRALQDYHLVEGDEEDDWGGWREFGQPYPADFQAEIQVMAHEYNLLTLFGPETDTRSSVLSDGDIKVVIERNPGERERWPRPRFE